MAVFVDASHYIALLAKNDRLHRVAIDAADLLTGVSLVTCEPVLVDVLAHVSRMGSHARGQAVGVIDDLRATPGMMIVPQTPELFEDGLALYRRRLDKGYSLTDCMSMSICRRLRIADVLTHDRNFEQEGFVALLRNA